MVQTPGGYVTLIITIYTRRRHMRQMLSFEVICSVFLLNGFPHTHTHTHRDPWAETEGGKRRTKQTAVTGVNYFPATTIIPGICVPCHQSLNNGNTTRSSPTSVHSPTLPHHPLRDLWRLLLLWPWLYCNYIFVSPIKCSLWVSFGRVFRVCGSACFIICHVCA